MKYLKYFFLFLLLQSLSIQAQTLYFGEIGSVHSDIYFFNDNGVNADNINNEFTAILNDVHVGFGLIKPLSKLWQSSATLSLSRNGFKYTFDDVESVFRNTTIQLHPELGLKVYKGFNISAGIKAEHNLLEQSKENEENWSLSKEKLFKPFGILASFGLQYQFRKIHLKAQLALGTTNVLLDDEFAPSTTSVKAERNEAKLIFAYLLNQ